MQWHLTRKNIGDIDGCINWILTNQLNPMDFFSREKPQTDVYLNAVSFNGQSLNPSIAKATFIQSTRTWSFIENHWNPVMLVFIRKLSLSTLRWVPICHGFNHISGFFHHFVFASRSSIRVKQVHLGLLESFKGVLQIGIKEGVLECVPHRLGGAVVVLHWYSGRQTWLSVKTNFIENDMLPKWNKIWKEKKMHSLNQTFIYNHEW